MPGRPVPSDKTAQRIESLYRSVSERISDEIKVAVLSGNLNRAEYLRERQAAIQGLLKAAEAQAAQATAIEIRNSYAAAGQKANEILKQAGARELKTAFAKTDELRINILIENATAKFNDITQFVGRRSDDIFRQIALEQVTAGTGLTRAQLSANLENALSRVGVTQTSTGVNRWINIGGRNWQLDRYAEMVARTTPREAASQAMAARIIDNGYDLVEISSHSSSCDICDEYDGNIYSLSGSSSEYEQLDELPPFHPNCGHVLTPAAIF